MRQIRSRVKRYWFVLPALISLATECGESPRGTIPSEVAFVELMLRSVPAVSPQDDQPFLVCLNAMGELPNHVRSSWRNNEVDLFEETSSDVFVANFPDVPVGIVNVMTVHDINECARNPDSNGHVTMGVTVNDIPITMVIGNRALAFTIEQDGTITQ